MINSNEISKNISQLIDYGIRTSLIANTDISKYVSAYSSILNTPIEYISGMYVKPLVDILKVIDTYGVETKILPYDSQMVRDNFETKIMTVMTPSHDEINLEFVKLLKHNPLEATEYYYQMNIANNYIRMDRVRKDERWVYNSSYGDIDISINLSKPEKDPKDIANIVEKTDTNEPKCLLCKENEGFPGNNNYISKENLRLVDLNLSGERWYLQYSPYVYYNEHCIVLDNDHVPMKISEKTFQNLLDFLDIFPHYFLGSNADLPIVGGSILNHNHYQGGRYEFALEKAKELFSFSMAKYPSIKAAIVNWPMSVIRLSSTDKNALIACSTLILNQWIDYSDESVEILANTNNTRHNTITPISRMKNGEYQLDLVLRNNRTTSQYPLGIFHPHQELHHIKKENIGLIEVMGLAILPGRLKVELAHCRDYLLMGTITPDIEKHIAWLDEIKSKNNLITESNVDQIIKDAVGETFALVLRDAGVFKLDEKGTNAFKKFVDLISK